MRVRIEIDAGERQAEFVRNPLRVLSDNPSAVLVDELVGAFSEAREWLERDLPTTRRVRTNAPRPA